MKNIEDLLWAVFRKIVAVFPGNGIEQDRRSGAA